MTCLVLGSRSEIENRMFTRQDPTSSWNLVPTKTVEVDSIPGPKELTSLFSHFYPQRLSFHVWPRLHHPPHSLMAMEGQISDSDDDHCGDNQTSPLWWGPLATPWMHVGVPKSYFSLAFLFFFDLSNLMSSTPSSSMLIFVAPLSSSPTSTLPPFSDLTRPESTGFYQFQSWEQQSTSQQPQQSTSINFPIASLCNQCLQNPLPVVHIKPEFAIITAQGVESLWCAGEGAIIKSWVFPLKSCSCSSMITSCKWWSWLLFWVFRAVGVQVL